VGGVSHQIKVQTPEKPLSLSPIIATKTVAYDHFFGKGGGVRRRQIRERMFFGD
jgi:hypothetical protein